MHDCLPMYGPLQDQHFRTAPLRARRAPALPACFQFSSSAHLHRRSCMKGVTLHHSNGREMRRSNLWKMDLYGCKGECRDTESFRALPQPPSLQAGSC